jgi:hypothetical protein
VILGAAMLLLAGPLGDLGAYPELHRYQHLPLAVRVYMDRRLNCDHWAGEEPYDRDRAREIDRALRSLKCERLDGEAAGLRRAYRHNREIQRALAVVEAG